MTVLRLRRGHAVDWTIANPILSSGEQGFEIDTGKFKIGDGVSVWVELDYFIPEPLVMAAIEAALAGVGTGGDGGASLVVHINSLTPHPVYDDGPSLMLLYLNAKV